MRLSAALCATMLAALSFGTYANAAVTYNLNVDGCSSGCGSSSYGLINVSGQGTGVLSVDIELNSNVVFQQAGNPSGHDEVWFDTNTSTVNIGGLVSPFQPNGVQSAGSNQANGGSFGTYNYVFQRLGSGNPSTASGGLHSLMFNLTGPSTLALTSSPVGVNNIFFVVDVAGFSASGSTLVNTGRVGATLVPSGVPEPASWALMILGIGGIGASLRHRRRTSDALA